MAGGQRHLADFLAALADAVDERRYDIADLLDRVTRLLGTLVARDDWLDDEFARPNTQYYQQHLLYCDPRRRFSVVSFVWGPGQQTPIHDHTVWGCVGMLRGGEICEDFLLENGALAPQAEARLEPGDVISFSPERGDIHRVRNAFDDRVSISIHVYGDDIGSVSRHVYTPEGDIKHFVSGYSNRVLPNCWGLA